MIQERQTPSVVQFLGIALVIIAITVFAIITIYLLQKKCPTWPTTIPMLLVSLTTITAMLWNIQGYIRDGNWLLTLIGGIILCAGFVLIVLSYKAFTRERKPDTAKKANMSKAVS